MVKSMGQPQDQKGSTALVYGLVAVLGGPVIEAATTANNYLFFTIFTTKMGGKNDGSFIGVFHCIIPL